MTQIDYTHTRVSSSLRERTRYIHEKLHDSKTHGYIGILICIRSSFSTLLHPDIVNNPDNDKPDNNHSSICIQLTPAITVF